MSPERLVESRLTAPKQEDPPTNTLDLSMSSGIQPWAPAPPGISLPDVQDDGHVTSSLEPSLDSVPTIPGQASLHPEDASESNSEGLPGTKPSESASDNSDFQRSFAKDPLYRQSPAHSKRSRASKIQQLEKCEKALARKYNMTGAIDSVDIFNRTKEIAMSTKDPHTKAELRQLHDLYKLRAEVESENSARVRGFSVDASGFWAVVIGIDAYENAPLRGCVADALAMHKYLCDTLRVPIGQIELLLGCDSGSQKHADPPTDNIPPTHANILKTLYGLIDHPGIKHGDNIIIYYAGHGTCYDLSQYYSSEGGSGDDDIASIGSLDALCPMDRRSQGTSDISDREINSILAQIARTKGNRITFILDCCHSAGVSRRLLENGERTAPPLSNYHNKTMLSSANERLKNYPGYRSVLDGAWCADMTSHVLLAACREYQFAKEVEREGGVGYQGFFTTSLINTLRSRQLREGATYLDLLRALPQWPHQTPVVAGKCKNTPLWYQSKRRV